MVRLVCKIRKRSMLIRITALKKNMDQEWLDKTAAAMTKRVEIKVSTGCSIWKGYVRKCRGGEHGFMNVQFPDSNSRTMMRVHRLAYIVHTGSLIPRQYDVSHLLKENVQSP